MKKNILTVSLIIMLLISVVALNNATTKILIFGNTQIEAKLDIVDKNSDTILVMVAGSGPTDYNGNSNVINGRNDSLLQLSKELNELGINTFRYNKRTVGQTSDLSDPNFNVFVSDLINCIKWLKDEGYSN